MTVLLNPHAINYANYVIRNEGDQRSAKFLLKNHDRLKKYEASQTHFNHAKTTKKVGIVAFNVLKACALLAAYALCCLTIVGALIPLALECNPSKYSSSGPLTSILERRFGINYEKKIKRAQVNIVEMEKNLNPGRMIAAKIKQEKFDPSIEATIATHEKLIVQYAEVLAKCEKHSARIMLVNDLEKKNHELTALIQKREDYASKHQRLQTAGELN